MCPYCKHVRDTGHGFADCDIDCHMCCDYCQVVDVPGVCRFEERGDST